MKHLITLDTETTGVDVYNDRIVTLFVGKMNMQGYWEKSAHFLLNPGIPIPEGASAVHGISTEVAQRDGRTDISMVLSTVLSIIYRECVQEDGALVVYNAPFDLTLFNSEMARHGVAREFDWTDIRIIDPLVLDKGLDKWRKGSRKLVAAAAHYKVPVEANAHDAAADCLMAGRIAIKQLGRLHRTNVEDGDLNVLQQEMHEEQQRSFEEYKRRNDPSFVGQHGWPVYS